MNLPFIMGFIGAAVGMIIGILIYSNIDAAVTCPTTGSGVTPCNNAKSYSWTVMGIMPTGLFFALFRIFGGMGQTY
jgi:hypothetical protein